MHPQNIDLISGIVEFLLSFVLGLLVAYTSYRVFIWLTRDIDEVSEIKSNNAAVGILLASMLIASAIIVKSAIYPSISSMRVYIFEGLSAVTVIKIIGLTLVYIVFTLVIAIFAIFIGMRLFLALTRNIDEFVEIKRNNVAVAVTIGAIILVLSLFLEHGISSLLQALIPLPSIEVPPIM